MHDIIAGRRSVRFFKKDPIAESDMKEILRAGQWAPSPKNRQPWKFIVVKGMSRDMMYRAFRSRRGRPSGRQRAHRQCTLHDGVHEKSTGDGAGGESDGALGV